MNWTRFIESLSVCPDGQEEILNELYKQMFIVAYSKVRNKSDALDVVQESWIKILQKIDSLRDRDKLVQWAKVIAANTAINMIKKKVAERMASLDDKQVAYISHTMDSQLESRILLKAICDHINQFDHETRAMFIYKFVHGWRDQQISDQMNIPLGTIKARIHRGKDKLRGKLSRQYENDFR